ncbi:MAG: hypothetical protein WD988_00290 [Candidatus Curtissbacteria bacterium]
MSEQLPKNPTPDKSLLWRLSTSKAALRTVLGGVVLSGAIALDTGKAHAEPPIVIGPNIGNPNRLPLNPIPTTPGNHTTPTVPTYSDLCIYKNGVYDAFPDQSVPYGWVRDANGNCYPLPVTPTVTGMPVTADIYKTLLKNDGQTFPAQASGPIWVDTNRSGFQDGGEALQIFDTGRAGGTLGRDTIVFNGSYPIGTLVCVDERLFDGGPTPIQGTKDCGPTDANGHVTLNLRNRERPPVVTPTPKPARPVPTVPARVPEVPRIVTVPTLAPEAVCPPELAEFSSKLPAEFRELLQRAIATGDVHKIAQAKADIEQKCEILKGDKDHQEIKGGVEQTNDTLGTRDKNGDGEPDVPTVIDQLGELGEALGIDVNKDGKTGIDTDGNGTIDKPSMPDQVDGIKQENQTLRERIDALEQRIADGVKAQKELLLYGLVGVVGALGVANLITTILKRNGRTVEVHNVAPEEPREPRRRRPLTPRTTPSGRRGATAVPVSTPSRTEPPARRLSGTDRIRPRIVPAPIPVSEQSVQPQERVVPDEAVEAMNRTQIIDVGSRARLGEFEATVREVAIETRADGRQYRVYTFNFHHPDGTISEDFNYLDSDLEHLNRIGQFEIKEDVDQLKDVGKLVRGVQLTGVALAQDGTKRYTLGDGRSYAEDEFEILFGGEL